MFVPISRVLLPQLFYYIEKYHLKKINLKHAIPPF